MDLRNLRLSGERVLLRSIALQDIPVLWELIYGTESPEWKQWDGPYFPLPYKTLEEYTAMVGSKIAANENINRLAIEVGGTLVGTVNYYWVHKESNWLEVGISIYRSDYWSKGVGQEALQLWVSHLFKNLKIVRVGLTTWSGNIRMMKCAEKLGMVVEATIRKARIVRNQYYDSVKLGILREEWESINREES